MWRPCSSWLQQAMLWVCSRRRSTGGWLNTSGVTGPALHASVMVMQGFMPLTCLRIVVQARIEMGLSKRCALPGKSDGGDSNVFEFRKPRISKTQNVVRDSRPRHKRLSGAGVSIFEVRGDAPALGTALLCRVRSRDRRQHRPGGVRPPRRPGGAANRAHRRDALPHHAWTQDDALRGLSRLSRSTRGRSAPPGSASGRALPLARGAPIPRGS